jgi:Family of unknown function (DUF6502)
MSEAYDVKRDLLTAYGSLMAPLVRILLRNGIAYHEFASVIREVYVSACAQEMTRQGRRGSLARASIMTGLTRREIVDVAAGRSRQRSDAEGNVNRTAKLLEAWHTDPEFLAPYGFPRDLSVDRHDPAGSFHSLVRKHIGEDVAAEILDELVRVGAARMLDGGQYVRVLNRTYIPTEMTPELVQIFSQAVRRYVETVDHNLSQDAAKTRRFDRLVYPDQGLRDVDVPVFQQEVREYLESVIAEIDAKAATFPRPTDGDQIVQVGVGLYFYREPTDRSVDMSVLLGDQDPE